MQDKRPWHYYALWALTLVSLALNAAVIAALLAVRQQTGQSLAQAAGALKAIQASSIDASVPIDQEIPVALDVPVKFKVTVPIKNSIPINTTVSVPIDLPLLGTRVVNVPINMTVPIDMTVDVPIDQSVPIDSHIPVRFNVPVSVKVADTTLGQGLGELQQVLQAEAESLGAGAP